MTLAIKPLPVLVTLRAAFAKVFVEHGKLLPRAALLPLLLSIAIEAAYAWMTHRALVEFSRPLSPYKFLVWTQPLVQSVPHVIFVVAWHRLVLADERPSWGFSWRSRHWGFFGYLLLGAVAGLAVSGLAMVALQPLVSSASGFLAEHLSELEAIRYSLLALQGVIGLVLAWFGARAMDHRFGLLSAWEFSRGNGLRIMTAGLVVFFLFLGLREIFAYFLAGLSGPAPLGDPGQSFDWSGRLAQVVVLAPLDYLGIAVAVSVVSLAYRHCAASAPGTPWSGS